MLSSFVPKSKFADDFTAVSFHRAVIKTGVEYPLGSKIRVCGIIKRISSYCSAESAAFPVRIIDNRSFCGTNASPRALADVQFSTANLDDRVGLCPREVLGHRQLHDERLLRAIEGVTHPGQIVAESVLAD